MTFFTRFLGSLIIGRAVMDKDAQHHLILTTALYLKRRASSEGLKQHLGLL